MISFAFLETFLRYLQKNKRTAAEHKQLINSFPFVLLFFINAGNFFIQTSLASPILAFCGSAIFIFHSSLQEPQQNFLIRPKVKFATFLMLAVLASVLSVVSSWLVLPIYAVIIRIRIVRQQRKEQETNLINLESMRAKLMNIEAKSKQKTLYEIHHVSDTNLPKAG